MSETSKKTPVRGKGRTHPATKGCCCKRSQCIKNYCDCYQSMSVCTEFCRCIGCRNTEERLAVEPRTPSRNSNASRKDRSASSSAKSAAAAAKEGRDISPVLPASSGSMPVIIAAPPVPLQPAMTPINIIRMAPNSYDVVLQEVATEQFVPPVAVQTKEVPTAPNAAKDPGWIPEQEQPRVMDPPGTGSSGAHIYNLFTPIINEAQLNCTFIEGTDLEKCGHTPSYVGCHVIDEYARCYKEVCEKILEM